MLAFLAFRIRLELTSADRCEEGQDDFRIRDGQYRLWGTMITAIANLYTQDAVVVKGEAERKDNSTQIWPCAHSRVQLIFRPPETVAILLRRRENLRTTSVTVSAW